MLHKFWKLYLPTSFCFSCIALQEVKHETTEHMKRKEFWVPLVLSSRYSCSFYFFYSFSPQNELLFPVLQSWACISVSICRNPNWAAALHHSYILAYAAVACFWAVIITRKFLDISITWKFSSSLPLDPSFTNMGSIYGHNSNNSASLFKNSLIFLRRQMHLNNQLVRIEDKGAMENCMIYRQLIPWLSLQWPNGWRVFHEFNCF